ncbi:hypothetical protein PG994_015337 [Apiospora phragmitis]|uniref:Uncharacterized protein n=1 Tax=Apiospora phragmitis TaxID=2905665 RepID=A0ABR1SR88_9PEZI
MGQLGQLPHDECESVQDSILRRSSANMMSSSSHFSVYATGCAMGHDQHPGPQTLLRRLHERAPALVHPFSERGPALVSILCGNTETLASPAGKIRQQSVRARPGNRWKDLAKNLDRTGFSAVAGVPCGAMLFTACAIMGGLSFVNTDYGNPTMITGTAESHLDIHKAQQGSGNAFDIVVAYAPKAYPQGEVWGGNYNFNATEQNNKKPIAVVRDFAEYYPEYDWIPLNLDKIDRAMQDT